MSFTSHQNDLLKYVVTIGSCLTILGTIFITTTYITFRELRVSFSSKLILYLTISDFCLSLGFLVSTWANCVLGAFLIQAAALCSILFSFVLTLNLQVYAWKGKDLKHKYLIIIILCLAVPLASGLVCLITDTFKRAGAWCWISNESPGSYFRFGFFYGPLLVIWTYILISILILFFLRNVKHKNEENQWETFGELRKRLTKYLIIFTCVWLFGVVNRTQNFLYPKNPLYAFYFIQSLTNPLQGFSMALFYCFGENLKLPQRVEDFLRDEETTRLFESFLDSHYMGENLSFYREVINFRSIQRPQMKTQKAYQIYNIFIKKTCRSPINVSGLVSAEITKNIENNNITEQIFDDALEQVFYLLETTTKLDFVVSKERNQMVSLYRKREIKGRNVTVELCKKLKSIFTRKGDNIYSRSIATSTFLDQERNSDIELDHLENKNIQKNSDQGETKEIQVKKQANSSKNSSKTSSIKQTSNKSDLSNLPYSSFSSVSSSRDESINSINISEVTNSSSNSD
ncbi:g protein-coupled receptor [Anaeramoeba flamelloides]|uniref:G protein-coupled receptor n=1 Tax=Anaeramoeba flamelloides TaxID=1746091 RepID=A0AAV7ZG68_9EUKA|nr:g protein-coupled receptor [Anaeramoeba flamelloides]